ncbi:hypothetical protein [Methylobacterium fujisawaense]|jgi:hypothetical protein
MRPLVGAVVLLAAAGTAQARDCSGIQDPAKRLQCYDAGAGRSGAPNSGGRPYEGAWAANASDCGSAEADGNFRIQGRHYTGWEQQCDIDKAVPQGDAWTLTMSCGGEGETWKETRTYAPEPGGRLSVRDKGRSVGSYVRCGGQATAQPTAQTTGTGVGTIPAGTLTEWAYDADRKLIWSCDDFDEGKAKACLAFACDYKSPTMTFFTRGASGAADAVLAPGRSVALPVTTTQEEKSFARLFRMGARTKVLEGNDELKEYFNGMNLQPIAVGTGRDRWWFATAAGRSEKPLADFRDECLY